MLKIICLEFCRDVDNYQLEKNTPVLYNNSMQYLAVLNIFIVKN